MWNFVLQIYRSTCACGNNSLQLTAVDTDCSKEQTKALFIYFSHMASNLSSSSSSSSNCITVVRFLESSDSLLRNRACVLILADAREIANVLCWKIFARQMWFPGLRKNFACSFSVIWLCIGCEMKWIKTVLFWKNSWSDGCYFRKCKKFLIILL
jgi:hypothetical protein